MAATLKPSIVIILLDALRADCAPGAAESPHLRSLGLKPPQLPALAGLLRGATGFAQAMACSAYTTACVGSLFTGLLPPEHGLRAFDVTSLSRDVRTLAEILAGAGYTTCAMTDQPPVLQPMGLLRGFQTIVANEDEALAWWDAGAGTARLLFLHVWDLHKPYGMPFGRGYRAGYAQIIEQWQAKLRSKGIAEPETAEFLDDQQERQSVYAMQNAWEDRLGFNAGLETYLAGLAEFDRGRLHDLAGAMGQRRMSEDTIFAVMADHGEGRDAPPSWRMTHGMSLADDVMRIPLYLRLPGLPAQGAISEQVSQADIAPTILDVVGLEAERTSPRSAYNGRSLLPLLHGKQLPERPAYAEISAHNNDPTRPVAQQAGERAVTLRWRVLRYPDRKYRLAGQPFHASEMEGAASDEAVPRLARRLLGRIERPADAAAWLPLLHDNTLPPAQRVENVLQLIYRSDEFRFLNKYSIYDLLRDPLEQEPVDARQKPETWELYQQHVAMMQGIDAQARTGEPLLTNEADEEVILRRLQKLGYEE